MAADPAPTPTQRDAPLSSHATTVEVVPRSTDMDADRIVNNAAFFQYFEQSRLEHLLRLGVIRWPPGREGGPPQFALAETTARFRAPAIHRDRLLVTTRTIAVGVTSFTLAYEIDRQDGTRVCDGSSVQVWLDGEGRSAALPPVVQGRLRASIA